MNGEGGKKYEGRGMSNRFGHASLWFKGARWMSSVRDKTLHQKRVRIIPFYLLRCE